MSKLWTVMGFLVLWTFVWYVIWVFRLVSPAVLPSPLEVLLAFPSLVSPSKFLPDVFSTVLRSLAAFLLSVPIGIGVGFAVFYSGPFRQMGELSLDFFRSIPATALVPVFLIMFGIGDTSKIAAGALSSSLALCLSTVLGLRNRNLTRVVVSNLLGLPRVHRFLYLDLPESLSEVFVGLRSGVSLALVVVVVSEMFIGSNEGLGKVINDMRYSDATPTLYSALLMTGIIGYAYNQSLIWLQRVVMHWQGT